MNFRYRKPRLRISKKGKISLTGGGVRIGGRNAGINISKSGASGTVGVKGAGYNTKRGWNCGLILLLGLIASGVTIGSVLRWVAA